MSTKRNWIIGGLAVAALSAAAVGAATARHGGHGWGHHGGGWHGKHFRRAMKRPMRMVCGRRAPERVDHMLVRIKHKADITEAQTPVFNEFADTVRTAVAKARESCPPKPDWKKRKAERKADRAEGQETGQEAGQTTEQDTAEKKPRLRRSPIERLENVEKMLAAGLEAVRTIRPSAEKLYASLSEEQQTKLRKKRGKRGWGKHRKWRKHHGRDGDGRRGSGSD